MEFEWNSEKESRNVTKHSVTFAEAMTVFDDPAAYTFFDPDHSAEEYCYLVFGYYASNRLLTVAYTYRNGKTRLITRPPRHACGKGNI